jgi:hypothetical protein
MNKIKQFFKHRFYEVQRKDVHKLTVKIKIIGQDHWIQTQNVFIGNLRHWGLCNPKSEHVVEYTDEYHYRDDNKRLIIVPKHAIAEFDFTQTKCGSYRVYNSVRFGIVVTHRFMVYRDTNGLIKTKRLSG